MQGQRSFALRETTQELCSVTFSDKTAKRCQRTEKQQWPAFALSKWSDKQLCQAKTAQSPTIFITVHLKNVQLLSLIARRYILQNEDTVA